MKKGKVKPCLAGKSAKEKRWPSIKGKRGCIGIGIRKNRAGYNYKF